MPPSACTAAGPAGRRQASRYRRPGRPLAGILGAVLIASAGLCGAPAPAAAQTPARDLFGKATTPAPLAARAIGSYAKGCLAGAVPLAVDGPTWQVMRLSRNRNWGHPDLIRLLERLSADARADGWNGLLVGDLAQPRGGPMTSGHSSHQIGLDADIWLTPMPDRRLSRTEREEMPAISMLKPGSRHVDPAVFTPAHAGVIRRAAKYPETARIFVHPGIKKALCETAGSDRAWLRKVRPWWGHHYHFHIRIACPAGSVGCSDQDPPPAGDGCGSELDWWLSDEPWVPRPGAPPPAPARPLTMADLPGECRVVLEAGAMPAAAGAVPLPRPRP
jgi:penicillin-insensitive murein endopeptidase